MYPCVLISQLRGFVYTVNSLDNASLIIYIFISVSLFFPGNDFLRVFANDYDEGENARVTFELPTNTADNDNFQIDPNTGMISNRIPFNRLEKDEYVIEVTARDNPTNGDPNTGKILICGFLVD